MKRLSTSGMATFLMAIAILVVTGSLMGFSNLFFRIAIRHKMDKINRVEGNYSSEIGSWYNYYAHLDSLKSPIGTLEGATGIPLFSNYSPISGILSPTGYGPSYRDGTPVNLATTAPMDSGSSVIFRDTGQNIFFKNITLGFCGEATYGQKGVKYYHNCLFDLGPPPPSCGAYCFNPSVAPSCKGPGANGYVLFSPTGQPAVGLSVAFQNDGKIIVGGSAGSSADVGGTSGTVTRFNPDLTFDATFSTGISRIVGGGSPLQYIPQPSLGSVELHAMGMADGLNFVCPNAMTGTITAANNPFGPAPGGSPTTYIHFAKLTSIGALDSTLLGDTLISGSILNGIVTKSPDTFSTPYYRIRLTGTLPDGSLVQVGAGRVSPPYATAFGWSGGFFNPRSATLDPNFLFALARYDSTERSLASSFPSDPTYASGPPNPGLSAPLVDTTLSPLPYLSNNDTFLKGMTVQSNGKVVALGWTQEKTGAMWHLLLVRFNPDGTLDKTFNGRGYTAPIDPGQFPCVLPRGGICGPLYDWRAISQQPDGSPDGKLLVFGTDFRSVGTGSFIVGRFNGNGTVDTTFGASGYLSVPVPFRAYTMRYQDLTDKSGVKGKIWLVGSQPAGSSNVLAVARLNQDGSLDPTFGSSSPGISLLSMAPNLDILPWDINFQCDGKAAIVGIAYTGATDRAFLARLTPTGSFDPCM